MVTDKDCIDKWGEPKEKNVKWEIATGLAIWTPLDMLSPVELKEYRESSAFPGKIYMNKLMVAPFTQAIRTLIDQELFFDIKSWDGCFYIRKMKTIKNGKQVFSNRWSLHSWGIAFDIDASWNSQGSHGEMDPKIVQVFKDSGFDWGGDFTIKDYMHFQLNKI
jgi:hypothetical protein